MNLKEELDELWAGIVEKLEFNILHHTIYFKVKIIDKGVKLFDVVFSKVSSFYFVENTGTSRFDPFDPDPGDYTELTTIHWYKNGIGQVKIIADREHIDWANQYYSSANFSIELWCSYLFIEAKSVTINGKTFEVGYPSEF